MHLNHLVIPLGLPPPPFGVDDEEDPELDALREGDLDLDADLICSTTDDS